MKFKFFIYTLFAVVVSLSSASCTDDEDNPYIDADITPIGFELYVNDANGTSMLDTTAYADFIKNTSVTYAGKEFHVVKLEDLTNSRLYLPVFYGLILVSGSEGSPFLFFGEFDGAYVTDNESFTINWGDGTSDDISYSNYININGKLIDVKRRYYVNGTETESYKITFVK